MTNSNIKNGLLMETNALAQELKEQTDFMGLEDGSGVIQFMKDSSLMIYFMEKEDMFTQIVPMLACLKMIKNMAKASITRLSMVQLKKVNGLMAKNKANSSTLTSMDRLQSEFTKMVNASSDP